MITKIHVAGFKAIYDSASVVLGPLTLFIGRNGAGKSSLLESLQWLQEALGSNIESATTARFGDFDELCNRRTNQMSIVIGYERGTTKIRYELDVARPTGRRGEPSVARERCQVRHARGVNETVYTENEGRSDPVRYVKPLMRLVKKPLVRKSKADPRANSAKPAIRVDNPLLLALPMATSTSAGTKHLLDFLSDAVFLRLSPTAIAKPGRLKKPSRGPALDETGARLPALLQSLTNEERAWVSTQLAEVIPGVKAVDVVGTNDLGSFTTKERMRSRGGTKTHSIPAPLLSEGTRRLAAIFALLAARPRPPMIAIEEIENGLDPWTLRFVFNHLQEAAEQGVQIVLTTHSPFLVDYVQPSQVIHVRRDSGNTSFTQITEYKAVLEDAGVVAPGAMYLSGYLTGPKISKAGEDD